MAKSESKQLFDSLFRLSQFDGDLGFDDLLRQLVEKEKGIKGIQLDEYISSKGQRLWNYFNKNQKQLELINTCSPVYEVTSDKFKQIKSVLEANPKRYSKTKLSKLKYRPEFLQEIDKINSREYEALACLVLELLGAKKVMLTPSGNEAGIDFIGLIEFGEDAHFLFGTNGPIRIIGQSKMYQTEIQVNAIKEFNATLNDVYSLTDKVKTVIPHWFRQAKGPIIGWIISHEGFQSGAIDRAKNYGIICSDSRDISELISCSRKFKGDHASKDRPKMFKPEIDRIINDKEINNK